MFRIDAAEMAIAALVSGLVPAGTVCWLPSGRVTVMLSLINFQVSSFVFSRWLKL